MRYTLIPALLALAVATACQSTEETIKTTTTTTTRVTTEDMNARSPELKALDVFTGKWTGTATMVEGPPQAMAMAKDGQKPTFKGGNTATWTLGGNFLVMDGWHEMGNGQTVQMREMITWDPAAKKYRQWWFSDNGEMGEGWMTRNGNTWETTWQGTKADGTTASGKGSMRVDGDQMTWNWTETGSMGTIKMTGTSWKK